MPADLPIKMLFVINPIAGGRQKTDWADAITKYFAPLNFVIDQLVLLGENDSALVRQKIEQVKPDRVVAVGGDGTVSLVAKIVAGTSVALGVLPAGSANGLATELGLPVAADQALEVVALGNERKADVIRINKKHICLHLSDIGLNARLIKHFEEGTLRGKWGYATKVLKTLWTKKSMKVTITINDKHDSHMALMVVLANATKYGTGAVINPEGDMYDGRFEVVIMRRLAISELFKMWFKPQPFNPKKIRLYPATSVSIQTRRKVHFQVDGEYLGKVNKVEAEIMPGQLKLIVP